MRNFLAIQKYVSNALGDFHKSHYVISPNPISGELPTGFDHICTDGAFFFHKLKLHLSETHCQLPDSIFRIVADELSRVLDVHHDLVNNYPVRQYPQIIILAFYQDGIIHALRRIIDMRGTGQFSHVCDIQTKIKAYEKSISEFAKARRYEDVAYFRGYQNALLFLLTSKEDEQPRVPDYFFPKIGEFETDDIQSAIDELPTLHKSAMKRCERILKEFPDRESIIPQRRPFG